MADNYVSIKIKASDTAKPDLDALKFELDAIGAKVETAKLTADDKEGRAVLLAYEAKLAALDKRVSNPRLDVAGGARVLADIAAVDVGLDKLNDKHADPKVALEGATKVLAEVEALDHELDKLDRKADTAGPGGLLGRILGGAGGAGGGMGSLGPVPLPAVAAAIPAVGALLVEVTGLVSGFAAAGAGAGAFGVLALPAIKAVSGALTQIKTDQNAYDRALTATAKNNALKHLHEDYAKLDPAQRTAVKGLQSLSDTYHAMAKAFEPEAFKVFGAGLKLVNQLLPAVTPFARSFADALTGLLGQASKFAGSKGFADWLKQFHSLEGPAVTAIGRGFGQVAIQLGKLLTVMSSKDVVNAINIAFTVLADTIGVITFGIRRFMQNWDGMSAAVRKGGHDVASVFDQIRHGGAIMGHDIAVAFDNVRHGLADSAHSWAQSFDQMRHTVASWAAAVGHAVAAAVGWFQSLPRRILGAVGNLSSLLFSAGRSVIQGLINGIESMIGSVGRAVGGIAGEIRNFLPFSPAKKGPLSGSGAPSASGRSIALQLAQGMESGLGPVRSAAARMAGSAGVAGGVAGGGGTGGAAAVIQIAPHAGGSGLDAQFWAWLKNGIRAQGGDPSMFNRKVQFL